MRLLTIAAVVCIAGIGAWFVTGGAAKDTEAASENTPYVEQAAGGSEIETAREPGTVAVEAAVYDSKIEIQVDDLASHNGRTAQGEAAQEWQIVSEPTKQISDFGMSRDQIVESHGSTEAWELKKLMAQDRSAYTAWLRDRLLNGEPSESLVEGNSIAVRSFIDNAISADPSSVEVTCGAELCVVSLPTAAHYTELTMSVTTGAAQLPETFAGLIGLETMSDGSVDMFAVRRDIDISSFGDI